MLFRERYKDKRVDRNKLPFASSTTEITLILLNGKRRPKIRQKAICSRDWEKQMTVSFLDNKEHYHEANWDRKNVCNSGRQRNCMEMPRVFWSITITRSSEEAVAQLPSSRRLKRPIQRKRLHKKPESHDWPMVLFMSP